MDFVELIKNILILLSYVFYFFAGLCVLALGWMLFYNFFALIFGTKTITYGKAYKHMAAFVTIIFFVVMGSGKAKEKEK